MNSDSRPFDASRRPTRSSARIAGHYAFFAHLKPGSFRVKEGSASGPAKVIALLGDSGNATAPISIST